MPMPDRDHRTRVSRSADRRRTSDGSLRPPTARRVAKSASAEMTTRPLVEAWIRIGRSSAVSRPSSLTCVASWPAERSRTATRGERFASTRNLKPAGLMAAPAPAWLRQRTRGRRGCPQLPDRSSPPGPGRWCGKLAQYGAHRHAGVPDARQTSHPIWVDRDALHSSLLGIILAAEAVRQRSGPISESRLAPAA